jgi:hypothetical protein
VNVVSVQVLVLQGLNESMSDPIVSSTVSGQGPWDASVLLARPGFRAPLLKQKLCTLPTGPAARYGFKPRTGRPGGPLFAHLCSNSQQTAAYTLFSPQKYGI